MQTNKVSDSSDALISLIGVVKQCYIPVPEPVRRGKKPDFSDLSFLLLAVVAVGVKTFSDSALHRLLKQDIELLRALEFRRVPHRTTIGRRIKGLIEPAEQQISLFGKQILSEIKPDDRFSQVSATDGRMYQSSGPAWHKKDRLKDRIPQGLRNVDRESSWSKSGYRGWVQGYRLVIQTLVFPQPVPLFSIWRKNSRNESATLLPELERNRFQVTDVNLADERLSDLDLPEKYRQAGGYLLTNKELPKKRRSWKNDLFDYRKESIELLFQRIIQAFDLKKCQVKGLGKNGAFVLVTVWVYQICFMQNYRKHKPLAVIKEQIEKARWRIKI